MNPPSENDIEEAIQLLVSRTYAANVVMLEAASQDDLLTTRMAVELEALRLAAKALETALERKVTSKATQCNALLAIHHLPVEILGKVFGVMVFDREIRSETPCLKKLLPLRRVSTFWRDVVDGTPWLWSDIDTRAPSDVIRMAIRNSRSCPVDVRHSRSGTVTPPAGSLIDLLPCLQRWHLANIQVSSQAELSALSTGPAPLLEIFSLKSTGGDEELMEMGPVDLFQGNAPRLVTITIEDVPMAWSSNIFSTAVWAFIYGVETSPTSNELYGMMSKYQRLDTLSFKAFWPPEMEDGIIHNSSPIELPRLSVLDLDLPYAQLCDILAVINAPRCYCLSIATTPPDSTTATISHLLDLTKPFLASQIQWWRKPSLTVRSSNSTLRCGVNGAGRTEFGIEFREVIPTVPMDWVITELERLKFSARVEHVLFQTNHDVDFISPSLERLPAVTEMRMESLSNSTPSVGPSSMLRRLSRPRQTSNGLMQWPFANLEGLYMLSGPYRGKILLRMLRRRYGVLPVPGTEHEGIGELILPEQLTSLTVYGGENVKQKLGDQIEGLVEEGGGEVVWKEDYIQPGNTVDAGLGDGDTDDEDD